MSRLGQFAKRYEQVQRGLQDQAERQLALHRQSERSLRDSQSELRQQKQQLQTRMATLRTGQDWQVAWHQLQLIELQEQELEEALRSCQRQIEESTAEVRKSYQEAERWDTLATREATKERVEQDRKAIQIGDDLAVGSHGRAAP